MDKLPNIATSSIPLGALREHYPCQSANVYLPSVHRILSVSLS